MSQADAPTSSHTILINQPNYPKQLLRLARPPAALYVRGQWPIASRGIAVVGSRAASKQAVMMARDLGQQLAAAGFAVISGGAIGVDGAAHLGALAGGGTTIAILGSGLDRLYPERHGELFAKIVAQGTLLTSFPEGTPPLARNFPIRNQLIAALSEAVIVVEAQNRSGALITAHVAERLKIPVFACPRSVGGRGLLHKGAFSLQSATQVISWLNSPADKQLIMGDEKEELSPDLRAVVEQLGDQALTVEELAQKLFWSTARVAAALIRLHLSERVISRLDGRFIRPCVWSVGISH